MMPEETYTQRLFTNIKTLILHEKDWESRLGAPTFQELVESGGLVRPSLYEIEGQVFPYFINGTFIDSDIVVEGDALFVNPLVEGYDVLSVKYLDIGLWKFSEETAISYIQKLNNLSPVQIDTVHTRKVLVVGQLKISSYSFLIILGLDSGLDSAYLETVIPKEELAKFHKVLVLSRHAHALENKFVAVSYSDFVKIPISAFNLPDTLISCEQLCSHFKYPLVIDRENTFIYLYGNKLGRSRNTAVYKFVSSMAKSRLSLPMETETFFKVNQITMQAPELAVKELRSQLKTKVLEAGLDVAETNEALAFFDLSGEKTRGDVDLKLDPQFIYFWKE